MRKHRKTIAQHKGKYSIDSFERINGHYAFTWYPTYKSIRSYNKQMVKTGGEFKSLKKGAYDWY